MTYLEMITAQGREAGRPENYDGLLFEPINDDLRASSSYDGWEFDHGASLRFYVGGLRWFMRASGIDKIQTFGGHVDQAVAVAADETNWTSMLNSDTRWKQMSPNQVRSARKMDHVFFQKAALTILTCELALKAKIERKEPIPGQIEPADVYRMMTIIPACANIDDFDKKFLAQLNDKHPEAINHLRAKTGQPLPAIEQLASGHTVTRATAITIKKELDEKFSKSSPGGVRVKPGAMLGTKAAAPAETIDAG